MIDTRGPEIRITELEKKLSDALKENEEDLFASQKENEAKLFEIQKELDAVRALLSEKDEEIEKLKSESEKAKTESEEILKAAKIKSDYMVKNAEFFAFSTREKLLSAKKTIDAALSDIPVVMATAKGAEYDKIRGLDLGADYYLTKPFGVMELVSCVKAVLRRCGTKTAAQLRCGGLVLDEESHTVTADGESVALTYKEFELLRLFLSHPGTAFSRDQLMADVWGTDYCGETRTVDMHIRTLRQKLGAYGEKIETVRGVGYRMEGKA